MLPPAQLETLEYLEKREAAGEIPPSIRDIMRHFGLKSVASVQARIGALAVKGFITYQLGKSRTIRVVRPGTVLVPVPESRVQEVLEFLASEVAA